MGEIQNVSNVLDVTIVLRYVYDSGSNKDIIEQNKIYFEEDSIRKYGLEILLNTDDARKYTEIDLNPSEVLRSNYLFNSTILYDRNGNYTRLKDRIDRGGVNKMAGIYYYDNLANIVPPIIDELNKIIEVNQMERDTSTVREFTKSRTFSMIKGM